MPYFIRFASVDSEEFKLKAEALSLAKRVAKSFPNCEVSIWKREGAHKVRLETIKQDLAHEQEIVVTALRSNRGVMSRSELISALVASGLTPKQIERVLKLNTLKWRQVKEQYSVKLKEVHYVLNKSLA